MTRMRATVLARQGALIVDWLTARVGDHLDRTAHEIDPTRPLAELGIDSVSAMSICGEIEDEWDIDADPTIVFDYPTIAALAGYIADKATVAGEWAA